MVAPSKLWEWPVNHYHCSQTFIHPGITCFQSFLHHMRTFPKLALVYFAPVLFSPLLFRLKSLNRDVFLQALHTYLCSVMASSTHAALIFAGNCTFRNLLGKFTKYTFLVCPSLCTGWITYLFPKRVIDAFALGTSQALLETLLGQYNNQFTQLLRRSRAIQTFIFMINSAIILHFKRAHKHAGFWFIKPEKPATEGETVPQKCTHVEQSCSKYILSGMKTYLLYGVPLDVLNMLLKAKVPVGVISPAQIIWTKLKQVRPNMTAFFVSYVGLYRLSSCLLSKYCHLPISKQMQHLFAAFLGGASYAFQGKLSFCVLSFVLAVQALWQQFCDSPNVCDRRPLQRFLQVLKSLPFAHIFYVVNIAYMVHCSILYGDVSSLGLGILRGVSNNRVPEIHKYVREIDIDGIHKFAHETPLRSAF